MYNFFVLASLCSLAGLFEPYRIKKPKGRYSRFETHFIPRKNVKVCHCRPANETPFKYCSLVGDPRLYDGNLTCQNTLLQNTAPVLLGVKYFTLSIHCHELDKTEYTFFHRINVFRLIFIYCNFVLYESKPYTCRYTNV